MIKEVPDKKEITDYLTDGLADDISLRFVTNTIDAVYSKMEDVDLNALIMTILNELYPDGANMKTISNSGRAIREAIQKYIGGE